MALTNEEQGRSPIIEVHTIRGDALAKHNKAMRDRVEALMKELGDATAADGVVREGAVPLYLNQRDILVVHETKQKTSLELVVRMALKRGLHQELLCSILVRDQVLYQLVSESEYVICEDKSPYSNDGLIPQRCIPTCTGCQQSQTDIERDMTRHYQMPPTLTTRWVPCHVNTHITRAQTKFKELRKGLGIWPTRATARLD